MQYDESPQRTRSLESWNRAKVSIRAAGWPLPSYTVLSTHAPKLIKMCKNQCKSIKIYTNPLKSMQYHESEQRTRSQAGIEQRFL